MHQAEEKRFHVSNRELRELYERGASHGFVQSEQGYKILVVPSDRHQPVKAYLLLSMPEEQLHELDTSLLKVFVNQAEMLYGSFTKLAPSVQEPAREELVRVTDR